jgi:hypothetical protein
MIERTSHRPRTLLKLTMNWKVFSLLASFAALTAPSASGGDLRGLQPANDPPGLIPPTSRWLGPTSAATADLSAGGHAANLADAQQNRESYTLYGGVREVPRLGPQATESYGGVLYPLAENWGSSLEAGVSQESQPRRYSLTGQLHTTLSAGHELSLGLKYRYDTPQAPFVGPGSESATGIANGPLSSRFGGGASYQLQLNYLYGVRNTVGLAYSSGRELEYFGLPYDALADARQLMLTGQHWLSPNWALNYDVYAPDSNLLRRQGLRLGLRYRF